MKELSKYNIDIYGLEDKLHVYEMESGDAFFEEMEQDLISHGSFKTRVELNKSSTMLQLQFHITGRVELECDRSLELFEEPVEADERIILKYGDHNEELTNEIEIIGRNTNRINVAKYIFEFIALSLPVKKIHPDFRGEEDEEEDDEEESVLVYSSEAGKSGEESADEEPSDPRWEALKKLKGQ